MRSITTDGLRTWAEALRKGQEKQIVADFKKGVEFAADVLKSWADALDSLDVEEDAGSTACPMPAQQGPSPLEVALLIVGQGYSPKKAVAEAYELIDAVRAEEARRAGK